MAPVVPVHDLSGSYRLDPARTHLGFVARHVMVSQVHGHFRELGGTLHIDAHDPARSSAEVHVRMASVSTGNRRRDANVRGAKFFDVEHHPEMAFHSTSSEELDGERWRVVGDLTVRDVTRPLSLDVRFTGASMDEHGDLRVSFEGSGELNRKDFGLRWNAVLETGGLLVSDRIRLELSISAVRVPLPGAERESHAGV